jgi:hypothetical protein
MGASTKSLRFFFASSTVSRDRAAKRKPFYFAVDAFFQDE